MNTEIKLWDEFKNIWPLERVKNMKLTEYSNSGDKDTFTYWIESKLDKLGSIWGGSAFKFGIYSRSDRGQKENIGKRMYTNEYGWLQKYGNTVEDAFNNVRIQILETIDAVQSNDLERIDQVDLGSSYKWKIAFHYQDSLEKPVCIDIFRRKVLEAASNSSPGTARSTMQRRIIERWDGSDFLEYAKTIWDRYSIKVPTTTEDMITEQLYKDNEVEDDDASSGSISHTEIQYLLLRLGVDLGFDVWTARNDKNKEYNGVKFSEMKNIRNSLPLQFDQQTNKTIEHIDVLWLEDNRFIAAFEIESTTSIYSGLLRMSDLISKQPNLNIPLYIVAPDYRRDKVIAEINRPTFSKNSPPLSEMCRYISFTKLKDELQNIKNIIKFLKPEYIDEISESCEPDEL